MSACPNDSKVLLHLPPWPHFRRCCTFTHRRIPTCRLGWQTNRCLWSLLVPRESCSAQSCTKEYSMKLLCGRGGISSRDKWGCDIFQERSCVEVVCKAQCSGMWVHIWVQVHTTSNHKYPPPVSCHVPICPNTISDLLLHTSYRLTTRSAHVATRDISHNDPA